MPERSMAVFKDWRLVGQSDLQSGLFVLKWNISDCKQDNAPGNAANHDSAMNSQSSTTASADALGIIAGNRSLPLVFAKQARSLGVKRLVAVAFQGETEPGLSAL